MKQTQTQEKENNQPCPQQIGEFDYYEKIDKGICPDCGAELLYIGGCKQCLQCAWAVC